MNNYYWSPAYSQLPLVGCTPSQQELAQYYQKQLLQKAMSVYKWKMPEYWNADYFKYTLYVYGFIAVLYVPEYGVIPQQCGLLDNRIMQEPGAVYVGNQFVQINRREIGDRCELFHISADYTGILDIVNFYANAMASLMSGLLVNVDNSKLAYMYPVASKKEADSVKTVLDNIYKGERAVVLKDTIAINNREPFTQNISQTYVVDKMLSDMRKLENDFDMRVGIPNTNVEKKERMNVDEVRSNDGDTIAQAWERLQRLQKRCETLNRQFDTEILTVDFNEKVVNPNAIYSTNPNANRDVSV